MILFVSGFIIGCLVAVIWWKSGNIALFSVVDIHDYESPLELNTEINDVLQEYAQRRRMELEINYAHLSADAKEVVVDNKMHELFIEMIDDLEQSVKKVKYAKS